MEEFLPGLVKLMEERLGRFGRPLTTIVVICIAFGVSAWGVKLFIDNAISPLYEFILSIMRIQGLSVERFITPFVIYIALIAVISVIFQFLYRKTIVNPTRRKATEVIKQAEKIIDKAEEAIRRTEEATREAEQSLLKLESMSDTKDYQS